MTRGLELLEQRLAKAYAEQAALYDRALGIVERQQQPAPPHVPPDEGGERQGTGGDLWVHELQEALIEVAAIDAASADDKSAWLKSGRSPSEPLRGILSSLAERIRVLAEHVVRRVAALTARRHQLLPELDGFIRQHQMLQAYDQYRRPSSEKA